MGTAPTAARAHRCVGARDAGRAAPRSTRRGRRRRGRSAWRPAHARARRPGHRVVGPIDGSMRALTGSTLARASRSSRSARSAGTCGSVLRAHHARMVISGIRIRGGVSGPRRGGCAGITEDPVDSSCPEVDTGLQAFIPGVHSRELPGFIFPAQGSSSLVTPLPRGLRIVYRSYTWSVPADDTRGCHLCRSGEQTSGRPRPQRPAGSAHRSRSGERVQVGPRSGAQRPRRRSGANRRSPLEASLHRAAAGRRGARYVGVHHRVRPGSRHVRKMRRRDEPR